VRIDPINGMLAHANHYTAAELAGEERSEGRQLRNSQLRQQRMDALLRENRGSIDATRMRTLLRDREGIPDSICRADGDREGSDIITFASVIAEPAKETIWVAVGPPNENPYRKYEIGKTSYIPPERVRHLSRAER
ncbi:MAG: carcinine hydrolase/isopenicillin-N N-acyltransferase family protein, partial [Thermomicrobiaceae bacterium]